MKLLVDGVANGAPISPKFAFGNIPATGHFELSATSIRTSLGAVHRQVQSLSRLLCMIRTSHPLAKM